MPLVGGNVSASICYKVFLEKSKDIGEEGEKIELRIKLAGIVIEIHGHYDYLKEYCRDYITEEEAELEIEITEKDILAECVDTEIEKFGLPYLETLAVLRKIADLMPEYDRFLMHGAVLAWKGDGYMFTAPSGTGKSTHVALWKKYLGDDVKIINGDKPILIVDEKEVYVCGTPWAGKEHWQTNASVPLRGICFLKRSRQNHIRKMETVEALPLLMRQVYYTGDAVMARKTMELLDVVFCKVPMYLLECDISEEAVRCSFNALRNKE